MSTIINSNGSVKAIVSQSIIDNMIANGEDFLYVKSDPINLNDYWNGSEWVSTGHPPEPYMMFNYDTKKWFDPRTLDQAKLEKWSKLKQDRSALEFGGFNYAGHIYDSDPTSQNRIMNAAAMGIAQEWTTKDNTVVSLSDVQIKELGEALVMYVAFVHELGRDARAKIDAAQTIEEVEAITL